MFDAIYISLLLIAVGTFGLLFGSTQTSKKTSIYLFVCSLWYLAVYLSEVYQRFEFAVLPVMGYAILLAYIVVMARETRP